MKLLIILFLFIHSYGVSAKACYTFLTNNVVLTEELSLIDQVITYLEKLSEIQVVTNKSLNLFLKSLENKDTKIVNPVPHTIVNSTVVIRSEDKAHYDAFEEVLNDPTVDKEKLISWTKKILEEKNRIKNNKDESLAKTEMPIIPMRFYPVNGNMEVMNTLVTQHMWVDVMKENPSKFQGSPNLPVEMVTIWSAMEFANRLSKAHGYIPIYNLDELVTLPNTRPENGTLAVQSGAATYPTLSNGSGKMGYRLPTARELRQLVSLNMDMNLTPFTWHSDNTVNKPEPVGMLAPTIINGHEFFDLLGNVMKWTTDVSADTPGPTSSNSRTAKHSSTFGFSYASKMELLFSVVPTVVESNTRAPNLGFFLVRDLK